MKKLPLLTMSALSALGILWACGSSDSSDDSIIPYEGGADVIIKYDTGADGPDPASGQGTAFCDQTLGTIKAAIAACCSTAEATSLQLDLFKNIDAYVTACGTKLESSIAQHRTAPTPQDFDACINGYKAVFGAADGGACAAVDTFRGFDVLSPSCATAFTGKGAVNAACAGAFDCASGLACIGYSDTTDGKCQNPAPQDGVCGTATGSNVSTPDLVIPPSNSCASGLYCNGGTCKTTIADNNTCTTDPSCQDQSCLMGHCDKARTGGAKSINGDGCITSDDCMTGFYCNVPGNVVGLQSDGGAPAYATGTCAPSKQDSLGCAAGVSHECLSDLCSAGSTCDRRCSFP